MIRFILMGIIVLAWVVIFFIKYKENKKYNEHLDRLRTHANVQGRMREHLARREQEFRERWGENISVLNSDGWATYGPLGDNRHRREPREGDIKIRNVIPNKPQLGQIKYIFLNGRWEIQLKTEPREEFLTEKDMEL